MVFMFAITTIKSIKSLITRSYIIINAVLQKATPENIRFSFDQTNS